MIYEETVASMNFLDLLLTIIALVVLCAAPGFILGPRVSLVITAGAAAALVLGMTYIGVWAAGCWSCELDSESSIVRHDGLGIALVAFVLFVVPMIVGLWLGALAQHVAFRRLLSD